MDIQRMIYSICFCYELLVCESIFLLRQRRMGRFPLRLALSLIVYFAAMIFLNQWYGGLEGTILTDILFFLAHFVGSMVIVLICFRLTFSQAFFVAAAGYSVEHIADSLVKIAFLASASGRSYRMRSGCAVLFPDDQKGHGG